MNSKCLEIPNISKVPLLMAFEGDPLEKTYSVLTGANIILLFVQQLVRYLKQLTVYCHAFCLKIMTVHLPNHSSLFYPPKKLLFSPGQPQLKGMLDNPLILPLDGRTVKSGKSLSPP